MPEHLRVRDYLDTSVIELVDHDDFDEKFFWFAVKIMDAPVRALSSGISEQWLDRIVAQANPTQPTTGDPDETK